MSRKQTHRVTSLVMATSVLVALVSSLQAEDNLSAESLRPRRATITSVVEDRVDDARRQAVIASDYPVEEQRSILHPSERRSRDRWPDAIDPEAAAATRELLQQHGSIVDGQGLLDNWGDPNRPLRMPPALDQHPSIRATYNSTAHSSPGSVPANYNAKVHSLRQAAWQLDGTAHRLEELELYEQSDALRDVADRLRRDARKIRQGRQPSSSQQSRDQPVPQRLENASPRTQPVN